MTNSDFPLCTKAGLKIIEWDYYRSLSQGLMTGPMKFEEQTGKINFINASEVEALLANAPVVYSMSGGEKANDWLFVNSANYEACSQKAKDNVHTKARLLLIEPIKEESEEIQLLKEALEIFNKSYDKRDEFIDRAKAFLARRDGKDE